MMPFQKIFIHIHTISVSWLYALGFWKTATVMLIFTVLLIWSLKDEPEDADERSEGGAESVHRAP